MLITIPAEIAAMAATSIKMNPRIPSSIPSQSHSHRYTYKNNPNKRKTSASRPRIGLHATILVSSAVVENVFNAPAVNIAMTGMVMLGIAR
jgi:hypothetical protein